MNSNKLLIGSIALTVFCVATTYNAPPSPTPLAILGLFAGFGALASFITWVLKE